MGKTMDNRTEDALKDRKVSGPHLEELYQHALNKKRLSEGVNIVVVGRPSLLQSELLLPCIDFAFSRSLPYTFPVI